MNHSPSPKGDRTQSFQPDLEMEYALQNLALGGSPLPDEQFRRLRDEVSAWYRVLAAHMSEMESVKRAELILSLLWDAVMGPSAKGGYEYFSVRTHPEMTVDTPDPETAREQAGQDLQGVWSRADPGWAYGRKVHLADTLPVLTRGLSGEEAGQVLEVGARDLIHDLNGAFACLPRMLVILRTLAPCRGVSLRDLKRLILESFNRFGVTEEHLSVNNRIWTGTIEELLCRPDADSDATLQILDHFPTTALGPLARTRQALDEEDVRDRLRQEAVRSENRAVLLSLLETHPDRETWVEIARRWPVLATSIIQDGEQATVLRGLIRPDDLVCLLGCSDPHVRTTVFEIAGQLEGGIGESAPPKRSQR